MILAHAHAKAYRGVALIRQRNDKLGGRAPGFNPMSRVPFLRRVPRPSRILRRAGTGGL